MQIKHFYGEWIFLSNAPHDFLWIEERKVIENLLIGVFSLFLSYTFHSLALMENFFKRWLFIFLFFISLTNESNGWFFVSASSMAIWRDSFHLIPSSSTRDEKSQIILGNLAKRAHQPTFCANKGDGKALWEIKGGSENHSSVGYSTGRKYFEGWVKKMKNVKIYGKNHQSMFPTLTILIQNTNTKLRASAWCSTRIISCFRKGIFMPLAF